MTKPWEDVRDDVVRLIHDGASLEQVRARLSKDRKFDASIRTYRKKLKQWKLTRTDQFEIQKANVLSNGDATSSIPSISLPSEAGVAPSDHVPSDSGRDATSRSGSVAESSMTTWEPPSPISAGPAVSPSTRAWSPPPISYLMPPDMSRPTSNHLEITFESLERAENGPRMFDILMRVKESQFINGTNTILHYAVSRTNFWVVDCILDFMLSQELDVDVTNTQQLTALETAILENKKENVESLLRANADIKRRHPNAGQPLHRATSSTQSAEICRVLLFHGAPPNDLQREEGSYQPTPLRILVGRALSLNRGHTKDRIAAMIEVLLEFDGHLSQGVDAYNHDLAILNFLDRWTRWGVPKEGRHSRGFYLGHFFRADCSPLCWFPARHCAECHSMASFVFSHTQSRLGHLLIESCDMEKFGLPLAKRIITPCTTRVSDHADSLSELLKTLLTKSARNGQRPDWDDQLITIVLEESPLDEKVPLLNTLINANIVLNPDRKRMWAGIAALDDRIRLPIAEILLNPNVGLVRREWYDTFMQQYLPICDGFASVERADLLRSFEVEATQRLDSHIENMEPDQRHRIFQCLIHVLTRFLMTEISGSIPERGRIEAFRLRDNYSVNLLSLSSRSVHGSMPFDTSMAELWNLQSLEPFSNQQVESSSPSRGPSSPNGLGRGRRSTTRSIEMGNTNGDTATHE